MRRDFWFSWRSLCRTPLHTIAAVACLAVGMAVCVAALSAMNALVFGELPGITHRRTLARAHIGFSGVFGAETVGGGRVVAADRFSREDFDIFEAQHGDALAAVAAEGPVRLTIASGTTRLSGRGAAVSKDYFTVLGTTAAHGRLFESGDFAPSAAPTVVIGHYLWRDVLGGRDDVVGSTLFLNRQAFTIVGVAPPQFSGIQPADFFQPPLASLQVWMPSTQVATFADLPSPGDVWMDVITRLAPNRRRADAEATLAPVAAHIAAAGASRRDGAVITLRSHGINPFEEPGRVLGIVALAMAIPLCVLAIGCANVANLQLARATIRSRELTVRLALGASRSQAMRGLTFEAAILAALGAGGGSLLAFGVLRWAEQFASFPLPLDARVLSLTGALAVGVTLISGWMPAWVAVRRASTQGMKALPPGGHAGHARLRNSLVAVQVALCVVLLFVTALALRSLQTVTGRIPADASRVVIGFIGPSTPDIDATMSRSSVESLVTRLTTEPGVAAVGVSTVNLFAASSLYWKPEDALEVRRGVTVGMVSPGWFDTVNAPLVDGRLWSATDANVAVVSASLATRLVTDVPHGTAVGRTIIVQTSANSPRMPLTVIGVTADPVHRPDGTAPSIVFLPMKDALPSTTAVYVRSTPGRAAPVDLRKWVTRARPDLAVTGVTTLHQQLVAQSGDTEWVAWGFGGLGILALLLATGGLYAVMSYVVSLRSMEIGIRMAIGARPLDVVVLVLRQATRLVVMGAAVGLCLAIPLSIAMQGTIVGVSPLDPLAMIPTLALLWLAGLAAAALPARRAAHIDPARALSTPH